MREPHQAADRRPRASASRSQLHDPEQRPARAVAGRGLVPLQRIAAAIVLLRGHKVLLDTALAGLYGVSVKTLNQAVRRNRDRFPEDFMFQLTAGRSHF